MPSSFEIKMRKKGPLLNQNHWFSLIGFGMGYHFTACFASLLFASFHRA
jgi:hypothetical protein